MRRLATTAGALVIAAAGFVTLLGPGAGGVSACESVGPKTGDLNADAKTNSLDALLVLFYEAGTMKATDDTWPVFADVNCDESVNAVDASMILQADAGLIELRA